MSFDDSNSYFRCFKESCISDNIKPEHFAADNYVEIKGLFASPEAVRRTGDLIRFSISGWTLPAPTVADPKHELVFDIVSKWTEDGIFYDIDRYNGFTLTLDLPASRPEFKYETTPNNLYTT